MGAMSALDRRAARQAPLDRPPTADEIVEDFLILPPAERRDLLDRLRDAHFEHDDIPHPPPSTEPQPTAEEFLAEMNRIAEDVDAGRMRTYTREEVMAEASVMRSHRMRLTTTSRGRGPTCGRHAEWYERQDGRRLVRTTSYRALRPPSSITFSPSPATVARSSAAKCVGGM